MTSLATIVLFTSCTKPIPCDCEPIVTKCEVPIVPKPILIRDANASNVKTIKNLIMNYSNLLDYTYELEEASKVCQ